MARAYAPIQSLPPGSLLVRPCAFALATVQGPSAARSCMSPSFLHNFADVVGQGGGAARSAKDLAHRARSAHGFPPERPGPTFGASGRRFVPPGLASEGPGPVFRASGRCFVSPDRLLTDLDGLPGLPDGVFEDLAGVLWPPDRLLEVPDRLSRHPDGVSRDPDGARGHPDRFCGRDAPAQRFGQRTTRRTRRPSRSSSTAAVFAVWMLP